MPVIVDAIAWTINAARRRGVPFDPPDREAIRRDVERLAAARPADVLAALEPVREHAARELDELRRARRRNG